MKDITLIFKKGSSIIVSTTSDPSLYDLEDLFGLELSGGCSLGNATYFATRIANLTKRPISFEWNEFTIKVSNTRKAYRILFL